MPADTVLLLTAPDFTKLNAALERAPAAKFLGDPAMKPFMDSLLGKWQAGFAQSCESDLGLKPEECRGLLQGQTTLALMRGETNTAGQFSALLLVDTGEKKEQARKRLASIKNKWADAGKAVRVEAIRGIEFNAFLMPTNGLPGPFRTILRHAAQSPAAEPGAVPQAPSVRQEFFVGITDSLLIAGTSKQQIEQVLIRLSGGAAASPSLGDVATYQVNHTSLFRESPLYGWINLKRMLDTDSGGTESKSDDAAPGKPLDLSRPKLFSALGFSGIDSLAFSFREVSGGDMLHFNIGVPGERRRGLIKILEGQPGDTLPPQFVPADAVNFQRWRLNGQKTWAAVEKILNDLSPQFSSVLNFLLDSANTYARQKQPAFDVRTNLLGNLGDDIIHYRIPASATAENGSASALLLIGSPKAGELADSLKAILVFLSQQVSTPPEERDFLGRKIFSLPLSMNLLSMGAGSSNTAPALHYCANNGYLALSTDAKLVEDFVKACDAQPKALREVPALREGAQKISDAGTFALGYDNQSATMRDVFEKLRTQSRGLTNSTFAAATALLPGAAAAMVPASQVRESMDFSLLPPYEKVSKYFSYVLYSGSSDTNGLTFRIFAPAIPAK